MNWTDTIQLKGKDYKFEENIDEPLTLIMKIDEKYHLQRDIDCDAPMEKIRLVLKYKSILNRVEKDDTFVEQIYYGKEIDSKEFMVALLEHALYGII